MVDYLPFLAPNLTLIAARWPALIAWLEGAPSQVNLVWRGTGSHRALAVEGLQLASAFDPQREADLQAAAIPDAAPEAWVYGLGLGHLPRRLLRSESLRRLGVVPLSRIATLAVLGLFDQRDWLRDERVVFALPTDHPRPRTPFAAVPPCLGLADLDSKPLADRVQAELNTPYLNRRFLNSPVIQRNLAANLPRLETDGRVQSLFGSRPGATLWVAAAGPSLERQFAALAARSAGEPLLAVDAALSPLLTAGIQPDVVLSIDGSRGVRFFFGSDGPRLKAGMLVYFPVVQPEVLDLWPGPRLAACSESELYASVRQHHGLQSLFCQGSVLHPAVDLAVRMGAATVRLSGVDLGFPGERTHVAHCAAARSVAAVEVGDWVLDGRGERIPSTLSLLSFLRDLEDYIARRPGVRFVNMGRDGAHIKGAHYGDA